MATHSSGQLFTELLRKCFFRSGGGIGQEGGEDASDAVL